MRLALIRQVVVGALTLSAMPAVAVAQTTAANTPPPASRGYVEVTAQSAFGHVTSQAYGGEFGYGLTNDIQLFVSYSCLLSSGACRGTLRRFAKKSKKPMVFITRG